MTEIEMFRELLRAVAEGGANGQMAGMAQGEIKRLQDEIAELKQAIQARSSDLQKYARAFEGIQKSIENQTTQKTRGAIYTDFKNRDADIPLINGAHDDT